MSCPLYINPEALRLALRSEARPQLMVLLGIPVIALLTTRLSVVSTAVQADDYEHRNVFIIDAPVDAILGCWRFGEGKLPSSFFGTF